jgi:2-oxoisovalerate dehydrogenase E2 component (dihydrolipoyl transacylase)
MAGREFLLPDLGEGLEEAEVIRWLVGEGDRVELNQPLVEVNTAKAMVEIPSPFEGIVTKLHAADGDIVEVGTPLVTFDLASESAGGEPERSPEEAPSPGATGRRPVLVGYGVSDDDDPGAEPVRVLEHRSGPAKATPPVRRRARELGVDLSAVPGSGPDGRITREDVEAAAGASSPAADVARVDRIPVRGTRRLIAQKVSRSARDIPHVTTFLTVDCSSLMAFRDEIAGRIGRAISPLPIVVRALGETIERHPQLNASFDADASQIVMHADCHVGIATDTDRGLVVPVVRDVRAKGIAAISDEIAGLAASARDGTIRPEQMVGGTITLTNVGSFGAESGTPIINAPEGAILATGVIAPRALVVEGEVVARPAMTLSLSFDHRLLDGAQAGRALRGLADLLESPFELGSLPR